MSRVALVERVSRPGFEYRRVKRTLLDDRNVLLCGNHLE
jgi:hypothetical protein